MKNSFENLATQFECTGMLLCVPGMDALLQEAGKEDMAPPQKVGLMMRMAALGLRKAPDTMRQLAAMELEKTPEEIVGLDDAALSPALLKVFSAIVIPFFASGGKQTQDA